MCDNTYLPLASMESVYIYPLAACSEAGPAQSTRSRAHVGRPLCAQCIMHCAHLTVHITVRIHMTVRNYTTVCIPNACASGMRVRDATSSASGSYSSETAAERRSERAWLTRRNIDQRDSSTLGIAVTYTHTKRGRGDDVMSSQAHDFRALSLARACASAATVCVSNDQRVHSRAALI